MVEFVLAVTFVMPVEEAEAIMAKSTKEMQRIALNDWLCRNPPDETFATKEYHSDFETFYTAYGRALAEKRVAELKMLTAERPPE